MKSIKEKAKESSLGYDEVQAPAIGSGFVLGANYVLNLLSETIHVSKDAYLKNNLFELIKQLKK